MFLTYKNIETLYKNTCYFCPYTTCIYSPDADIIVVRDEHSVFRQVLPLLMKHPKKFILIYYMTDSDFTPQYFECLRPYVIHVYAQACRFQHPMITSLPTIDFNISPPPKHLRSSKKEILCYLPRVGLFDDNNMHHLPGRLLRQDCIKYFENNPIVTIETDRLSLDDYYKKLCSCKFVICPMGVGIDSIKIYESVYLGATPIVVKNGMEDLYKKFGVLVVDGWDDVTESLLESHIHYQPPDELFELEYWIKPLKTV